MTTLISNKAVEKNIEKEKSYVDKRKNLVIEQMFSENKKQNKKKEIYCEQKTYIQLFFCSLINGKIFLD